jgi:hypothetical protein
MSDSIKRTAPAAVFGLLFGAQIGAAAVASPLIRCAAVGVVSTTITTLSDDGDDQSGPQDGPDVGGVNGGLEPVEEPILTNHDWRLR